MSNYVFVVISSCPERLPEASLRDTSLIPCDGGERYDFPLAGDRESYMGKAQSGYRKCAKGAFHIEGRKGSNRTVEKTWKRYIDAGYI